MTRETSASEKKYMMARRMAENLRERGLITEDEFAEIDTKLKVEMKPVFGDLFSETTCYYPSVE